MFVLTCLLLVKKLTSDLGLYISIIKVMAFMVVISGHVRKSVIPKGALEGALVVYAVPNLSTQPCLKV